MSIRTFRSASDLWRWLFHDPLMRRSVLALLACLSLGATACTTASIGAPGSGSAVRDLTGAHTRIVWVQGDGTERGLKGDQLALMAFDSDDGKGERVILGKGRNYRNPLLTSRGTRIVFSSILKDGALEVYSVNWDGSGLRKLTDGYALTVWSEPGNRRDWVYVGSRIPHPSKWDTKSIIRFPLDAPDKREPVWTKSIVSMEGFNVSADGRRAGGLFPWPKAGVAELPDGRVTTFGEGCWTSFANARGPLFWYFDGAHRNVTMVDVESRMRWVVNINNAPGFDGAEVNHPQWTNHSRVLVLSGPYNQGGPNQARTGGKQSEIYLGRFSEDFSAVEKWTRVTNNGAGDSQPNAWIHVSRTTVSPRPAGPVGPPHVRAAFNSGPAGAASDAGRLLVNVQLTRPGPIPSPQDILPYRHALVVNEYKVREVLKGRYEEHTIHVAQWAIRDSRVLPDARKSVNTAFTLTVEPYDAHPELEGERLISTSNTKAPLYYDVSAPAAATRTSRR
jgi:hypothetical protein